MLLMTRVQEKFVQHLPGDCDRIRVRNDAIFYLTALKITLVSRKSEKFAKVGLQSDQRRHTNVKLLGSPHYHLVVDSSR